MRAPPATTPRAATATCHTPWMDAADAALPVADAVFEVVPEALVAPEVWDAVPEPVGDEPDAEPDMVMDMEPDMEPAVIMDATTSDEALACAAEAPETGTRFRDWEGSMHGLGARTGAALELLQRLSLGLVGRGAGGQARDGRSEELVARADTVEVKPTDRSI
jgi:hypothetical protein